MSFEKEFNFTTTIKVINTLGSELDNPELNKLLENLHGVFRRAAQGQREGVLVAVPLKVKLEEPAPSAEPQKV
jgi:hypothetical protein